MLATPIFPFLLMKLLSLLSRSSDQYFFNMRCVVTNVLLLTVSSV